jgi:carbamoyltransferase
VEEVEHAEITQERVDKAAAVQLVFEDALLHVVEHLISVTKSSRLVLTGGVALNCVANMRLMEAFDRDFYRRHVGARDTTLQLWVPPVPNDAGTPVGAAYAFAMQAGARGSAPLRHAFYCGRPPERTEIDRALEGASDFASLPLGDATVAEDRDAIADLIAYLVSQDGVAGIYQGSAETGPRALGHRSIVANPTNPETLSVLNARVKFRERIRPLAPMLTERAAVDLFELADGAGFDDYSAYNFMILTARARPEARSLIPAVIHHDGTGRLQIVRPELDPFSFAYLEAMGRRVGVEVSVNTSLNVGAPIAQTPEQALETARRAKGLDALLMVASDGSARLVWQVERFSREERLGLWLPEWTAETGRDPLSFAPAASLRA